MNAFIDDITVDDYELSKTIVDQYDETINFVVSSIANGISDLQNENRKDIKAIDLGCGDGHILLSLQRQLEKVNSENKVKLIGVDISKKLLPEPSSTHRKVDFVECDALSYLKESEDNSADIIISSLFLHNFNLSDKETILKEINRVIREGGYFFNLDKIYPNNPSEQKSLFKNQIEVIRERLEHKNPMLMSKLINHYQRDNRKPFRITLHEYNDLTKKSGFKSNNTALSLGLEKFVISMS